MFLVLLFPFSAMAQNIYFVDASKADNSGAGTSWTTAKKDLQTAINSASSGDAVWVKAGTYLPTHDPFGSTAPANNLLPLKMVLKFMVDSQERKPCSARETGKLTKRF